MAEIVKCPFCGGVATVGGLVPWVECQSCGASGPQKTTDEEAIAAWNTRHGAGDGEALRDLHDSIRIVYDAVPTLPITAETMDAATDALHAFCLMVGIHKVDIDTPTEDAARAGEREVAGG